MENRIYMDAWFRTKGTNLAQREGIRMSAGRSDNSRVVAMRNSQRSEVTQPGGRGYLYVAADERSVTIVLAASARDQRRRLTLPCKTRAMSCLGAQTGHVSNSASVSDE